MPCNTRLTCWEGTWWLPPGATREPIDPICLSGNRFSGKTGFALADAARARGAQVTLITTIPPPSLEAYDLAQYGETVAEMRKTVVGACRSADVLLMAAAVSDFRVANPTAHKLEKQGRAVILELTETEDFLLELRDTLVKVGFAAETEDLVENVHHKLVWERLAFICAKDVTAAGGGVRRGQQPHHDPAWHRGTRGTPVNEEIRPRA